MSVIASPRPGSINNCPQLLKVIRRAVKNRLTAHHEKLTRRCLRLRSNRVHRRKDHKCCNEELPPSHMSIEISETAKDANAPSVGRL